MDEYEGLSRTKWECKCHVIFIPKYRAVGARWRAPGASDRQLIRGFQQPGRAREQLTERYEALCEAYRTHATRNNAAACHENGRSRRGRAVSSA